MPVRIDRRQFLKAAAITGGAIGAGIALPKGHGNLTWAGVVPRCRLGGNGRFISAEEPKLGEMVTSHRIYKAWSEEIFSSDVVASADQGRRLLISIFPANRNGSGSKRWADIAAGKYDADIKDMAGQFKSFAASHPKRVGLCFHHEPESEVDGKGPNPLGTVADFRAAWKHFFSQLSSSGVTNIRRTLILLGSNYEKGTANDYWPGASYVDRLGVDCYNWFASTTKPKAPWRSFQQIVQSAYDYSVSKSKVLWVCETATLEDPNQPGRKAQWISDMGATLKSMPNIRGAMYFEGAGGWWLSTPPEGSAAALSAFKNLLEDPYFL